jgi:hypothetical protein
VADDKYRVDSQTSAFLDAGSYERSPDARPLAVWSDRHWRERQ